jgi:hypothetical protein
MVQHKSSFLPTADCVRASFFSRLSIVSAMLETLARLASGTREGKFIILLYFVRTKEKKCEKANKSVLL